MDVNLDDDKLELGQIARQLFERRNPTTRVRELEGTEPGYDTDLWREMAGLDWLALGHPAEAGGVGDLVDLTMIYREMGRAAVPSPHLISSVVSGGVLAAEPDRPRADLLASVLAGDTIVSAAATGPDGLFGPAHVGVAATRDGDGWSLTGSAGFVPWANAADQLLVAARTGESADSITLLLVDPSTVPIEAMPNIAGSSMHAVHLDGTRVGAEALVGAIDRGWELLGPSLDRAIVARCAEIVGVGSWLLDAAVGYALEREQFGQPIGRFQAVQYLCTDIAIAVHLADLLTRQAAWMLTTGDPDARRQVSPGQGAGQSAAQVAAQRCHEVHAGVAFMLESDVQLYSRRARVLEVELGDARHHDEVVAALTVAS